ncbi:MAG: T9SS type A sorting domain-containing protein [Chitinophagales bacterium]
MRYTYFLALLIFLATPYTFAQECDNERFSEAVFENVTVSEGIEFGYNNQPTLFNPDEVQFLNLDFYEPEGDNWEERPLIIWAFGGAFVLGTRTSPDIVELANRFTKLGYVNASIDYRLSTSLALNGSEEAALKAVLKAVHDMKAAIRFFRKDAATDNLYRINPDQIYIAGVSAGAIAALHTAYLNEDAEIPDLLLDEANAVGGIEGLSGNAAYSSSVAGVISLSGAIGDLNWLNEGDIPVVSIHGTADDIVPYGSDILTLFGINMLIHGSSQLHERANEVNIPNAFLSFEGAGHTPFVLGDNSEAYMDSTFNHVSEFMQIQVCEYLENVGNVGINTAEANNFLANYPNPFAEKTFIKFDTDFSTKNISLKVYDLNGRLCAVNYEIQAHQIVVERGDLANGMYFYSILGENKEAKASGKMMVK